MECYDTGMNKTETDETETAETGMAEPDRSGPSFWRGSYTVEAAAVVSITILVLAALLIATFYVHDRAVFQSIACECAALGSNYCTDSERTSAAASAKDEISASRFLGSRDVSGSATVGEEKAESAWSAVYPVPGFALSYFTNNVLTIQTSWDSQIVQPADTIRLIRGAGKLLSEGDD